MTKVAQTQPIYDPAKTFDAKDDRPKISLIVTGMGLSEAATEAAISLLPGSVTLAFDPYAQKLIMEYVPDPIAVTEKEARNFVCNGVVVDKKIVLPKGLSSSTKGKLKKRGFTCLELDLSEFIKAGGAAKCLTLKV